MKNTKYIKSDLVMKEIARICKVQNRKIQIGDYEYWVDGKLLFEQYIPREGSKVEVYTINE